VVIPLERHTDGIAWWWLIPSALLGAAAAWLLLKRRRPAATEWEEPPAESPAADEPALTSPSLPQALAAPEPTPPPAPQPVSAPAAALPFELSLVPERLSVSLVNATLNYRIIVTNRSAAPLGPMAVAADMIGAHASLPEEMQLAQDGRGLELRHEVPPLGPGETAELRGDLRLPLAEVTPIRSGNATLLVPLVRLRAEAGALSLLRTIVVGETPQTEGAPLRPFRLDTGPRIFGAVSQREVAAAA